MVFWYRFRSSAAEIQIASLLRTVCPSTISFLSFIHSVMLIVNVSVNAGCAHQNIINYCIIPCFMHEICFAGCSLDCFRTSSCSCCMLCCVLLCFFLWFVFLGDFFSLFFLFILMCHCCCTWINEFKRKSIVAQISIIIFSYLISLICISVIYFNKINTCEFKHCI